MTSSMTKLVILLMLSSIIGCKPKVTVTATEEFKTVDTDTMLAVSDSLFIPNEVDISNHDVIPSPSQYLTLTFTELFPDSTDRAGTGYQGFTGRRNGIIKAADFYHGSLEVQCSDGEYLALRIESENLSTYKKSDLRFYMKPGNKIEFVCAPMGARELMIISARFTE